MLFDLNSLRSVVLVSPGKLQKLRSQRRTQARAHLVNPAHLNEELKLVPACELQFPD